MSYTADAGVTLRLRSASANTAATYRVADPEHLKVGVVSVTPEIALSIAPNYIGEGDSFNLVATATPPAVLPITVNVTLSSTDSDAFSLRQDHEVHKRSRLRLAKQLVRLL